MTTHEYRYCPQCAQPLQMNPHHQRLACADDACGFVHWNNPQPVVAAIVLHGDTSMEQQVLLVRNQGWPEGMLGLVSGFLENGETPEQGIVRELHEELGLTSDQVRLLGHYPFAQANQLLLVYEVQASGTLVVDEQEIAAVKYVAASKLRAWPFGTGPAVQDWLDARG